MSNRKEELILKYLEKNYGNRETFDNETSIGVNGVCIYYKSIKQVGATSKVYNDLRNWFGPGRHQRMVEKWFTNKFNVDVI